MDKLPYQTNDLLAMKKEALLAGDIDTLRDIRDYERSLRIYYKRLGEDAIRSEAGEIVNLPMSLPEIFAAMDDGTSNSQKPGSLLVKVQDKKAETLIIEIKAAARFPIARADLSSLRAEHTGSDDRVAGVKFHRPCPGLYYVSAEDMTPDQLKAFIDFSSIISE